MSRRGFSPLERRILLTLLSPIRDRESDREFWPITDIKARTLYDALYIPGDRSHEIERRNQRQAQRRALGRLHRAGFVGAMALAWINLEDEQIIRWQGGGSRQRDNGHSIETPRWQLVSLTHEGISAAEALEREQLAGSVAGGLRG